MRKFLSHVSDYMGRVFVVYAAIFWFLAKGIDWTMPNKNRMNFLLGIFYNNNYENYEDGLLFFQRKVQTEPNNATAHAGLGICYYNLKNYPKAIAAYKKAMAISPDLQPLKVQLAIIYKDAGMEKEAEDVLKGNP